MGDYYLENSFKYIETTKNCDMQFLYDFFEEYLPIQTKTILDLGFGSGRDSLYFKQKYDVSSIDSNKFFCEYAISIGLENVFCMKAEEMNFDNSFDGIWACASLLHVSSKNIKDVFKRCHKALKENGVMYCSFKYGSFEGIKDGRYYLDLNEILLEKYLKETGLIIVDMIITDDVRKDIDGKWLNAILKKKSF